MEIWQPYRYLSHPRPVPEPIEESQFHRTTRAVACAFLVALACAAGWAVLGALTTAADFAATAFQAPKTLFAPEALWTILLGAPLSVSLITAPLTLVFTPFSFAVIMQDHRRASRLSPNTPLQLTPKNVLLSRLGLSVMIATLLGIGIACAATPSIFAAADKSTSDMNFGYLVPFVIPAPAMLLLTLPIFAVLSRKDRK